MFHLLKILTTLASLMNASATTANQYSAHTHGHAELTIAIDKNNIDLKLITPAANLLGFEHKATTASEISQVIAMKKHLAQHANVIIFNHADCHIKSSNINTGDILNYDHQEHAHEHENRYSHTEIIVDYQFHCANASDISSASVKLFKHYTGLEKIDVMWLTAFQQGSIELDMKNTGISFQ